MLLKTKKMHNKKSCECENFCVYIFRFKKIGIRSPVGTILIL